jgi:hypothetical protein
MGGCQGYDGGRDHAVAFFKAIALCVANVATVHSLLPGVLLISESEMVSDASETFCSQVQCLRVSATQSY